MNDIERAREMLAAEYEKAGIGHLACHTRTGAYDNTVIVHALIAALTPPEGYVSRDELLSAQDRAFYDGMSKAEPKIPDGFVLVPVEPTAEMLQAAAFGVAGKSGQKFKPMMSAGYRAMLTARPEVSP